MAVLDSTVGGAAANSYASVSDLEAYMEIHPYYGDAVFDDEEALLQYATVLLESLVVWKGYPATDEQALHFPTYGTTEIPTDIKNAQMELVFYLNSNSAVISGSDFKTIEFGQIRIDMQTDSAGTSEMLPELVQTMISEYGSVKSSGIRSASTIRVVRG